MSEGARGNTQEEKRIGSLFLPSFESAKGAFSSDNAQV